MNGRKILIAGNHDIFKLQDYAEHFEDKRAMFKINRLYLQHAPLHRGSIRHWCDGNVHAHLHSRLVRVDPDDPTSPPDPLYFSTCVEVVGISPVPIEEIELHMSKNRAAQLARYERINGTL